MKKLLLPLIATAMLQAPATQAVPMPGNGTVLGTGTGALVGGDLTDPQNDGLPNNNTNYDAIFRSSVEAGFGGGEYAFNVFDNLLGPGNDKWCCDGPGSGSVWVEADFGGSTFVLSSFTIASANDVAGRDADQWQILGSNDGINYTAIFDYNNDGVSAWGSRLQVNQYIAGDDFSLPQAFSIFRYEATSVVSGGLHQLGELEFFGTSGSLPPIVNDPASVPEPGMLSLLAFGLCGIGLNRRRKTTG